MRPTLVRIPCALMTASKAVAISVAIATISVALAAWISCVEPIDRIASAVDGSRGPTSSTTVASTISGSAVAITSPTDHSAGLGALAFPLERVVPVVIGYLGGERHLLRSRGR